MTGRVGNVVHGSPDPDLATLGVLASAVAGRRLVVARSGPAVGSTFCDGRTIWLAAGDRWPSVVTQASLVAAGSLDPGTVAGLIGRPRAAQRYCALEIARGAAICAVRCPPINLGDYAATTVSGETAAGSRALALSRAPLPPIPAWFGTVRPGAILRAHALSGERRGDRPGARGERPVRVEVRRAADDTNQEDSALWQLLQNPFARRDSGKSVLSTLVDAVSGGGGAGGAGVADGPVGAMIRSTGKGPSAHRIAASADPGASALRAASTLRYPEWDAARCRYRPAWVHVEIVPVADDAAPAAIPSPGVRRLTRCLRALGLARHPDGRQIDGIELDLDAVIDLAVDRKVARFEGDPRIFRHPIRRHLDLVVSLILDASGSTATPGLNGDALFDRHRAAALTVLAAFDQLGALTSGFAFQGWGRRLFRTMPIKSTAERFGEASRDRLGRLQAAGFTRLGAAIRHAAVQDRFDDGRTRRLLIVLTDGLPFDQGYELAHAAADSRRAVEEARAGGIACLGLSLGGDAACARLHDIFGPDAVAGDDIDAIAGQLGDTARRALGRAAAMRPPARNLSTKYRTHANSY